MQSYAAYSLVCHHHLSRMKYNQFKGTLSATGMLFWRTRATCRLKSFELACLFILFLNESS